MANFLSNTFLRSRNWEADAGVFEDLFKMLSSKSTVSVAEMQIPSPRSLPRETSVPAAGGGDLGWPQLALDSQLTTDSSSSLSAIAAEREELETLGV